MIEIGPVLAETIKYGVFAAIIIFGLQSLNAVVVMLIMKERNRASTKRFN